MKLYTIGHSNHDIRYFIKLLREKGAKILVDVRSAPYSRYNPQYNKENLEHSLKQEGIHYIYAGKYLGGRPADPSCYRSKQIPDEGADYLNEVDYLEVMKRDWFLRGISRLEMLINEQNTVIMCSEEDPALCHRHHLIARYMMINYPDMDVFHIRKDGSVYGARSIMSTVDKPPSEQLRLF
ncbi:MAG: DUF488 domain-containing protein [Anaerolineales bacterium]|nr:DUF488 domain-containing protein [Anaerolineales bacterium]